MSRDLNDTLTFVKVVQEGSFTAAAKALRIPKTTVSRKVRDLELRLGARLLNRTTRRLGLTEAGAIYFERCERIARDLDEAESAVGQLQGAPRGWLRVTAPYSFAIDSIGPLLADFRALYPAVRLDLTLSHENLDLVAREIDIAIRMGSLKDSTMASRRLGVLPTRVYAAPVYLEKHGEPARPDELWEHSTLVNRAARRASGYAWMLRDAVERRDFPLNPVMAADDPEMLKGPLFAGAGLVLATDLAMGRHVAAGQVQPVLPAWKGPRVALNAVFPGGRVQPPKVRVFIDFLALRLDLDPKPAAV